MNRRERGQAGEAIALRSLETNGYTILAQNWRSPSQEVRGELDIIARTANEIVFVEVRSRRDTMNAALESITGRKATRLTALAQYYLELYDLTHMSFRIDLITISFETVPPQIEIIENAIGW